MLRSPTARARNHNPSPSKPYRCFISHFDYGLFSNITNAVKLALNITVKTTTRNDFSRKFIYLLSEGGYFKCLGI